MIRGRLLLGRQRKGAPRRWARALGAAVVLALFLPALVAGTILRTDTAGATAAGDANVTEFLGINPEGIAAGPDGALWFTNPGNDSIGRISTSGTITFFTDPRIIGPGSIVAGPDGALWFTNASGIGRITTAGVVSTFSNPAAAPLGSLIVGPDGALWFLNASGIGRMTTGGAFSFYLRGDNYTINAITSGPDGALWFTNEGQESTEPFTPNAVVRMTTGGVVTNTYYVPGVVIGGLGGITTGPDGALWLGAQSGVEPSGYIMRMTTAGAFTTYSYSPGLTPEAIVSGPDGALWFTDPDSDVVGRITTAGVATTYTDPSIIGPTAIAVGSDGALWFVNSGSEHRTGAQGQYSVGRVTTAGAVSSFVGPDIEGAEAIAAGPDGALWFTNSWNNTIGRISTTGVVSHYSDPTIDFPVGIAVGPDGALWFTNAGNNSIGRITTAGVVTNYTGPGLDEPEQITTGPDGALWFTNSDTGAIGRITTSGVVTSYPDPGFTSADGITAGSDGALWFTGNRNNAIGRITTAGVVTTYSGTGIDFPEGITSGPDGALWFANSQNDSIGRITTAGAVTNYPLSANPYGGPIAITVGPDGAMWFTNSNSSSIGRITTSGLITSYTAGGETGLSYGITSGPDGALWYTLATSGIGRIALTPPTTSVLLPSPSATVSGAQTIDAAASNAAKVSFLLTGGPDNATVIGSGTPTYYGWLASWNTTTVPNGAYTLRSVATDTEGLQTTSAAVPFTVNNGPPGTAVLLPSGGATVSGASSVLDGSATANVTSVTYELSGGGFDDKVIAKGTATYYGWLASWNTTAVPNGTYTVQSVAAYAGGVSGTSAPVTLTVNNGPPSTAVLLPAGGATVSGSSSVLNASAPSPVTTVTYELSGGSLHDKVIAQGTPTLYGWLASWNTASVPDGSYTLQSVASYAGGVSGTSAPVTITIGN